MNKYHKLPLYLGLLVMVITILVSAVTLGQRRSVSKNFLQATSNTADLSMRFTPPNLVTVILNNNSKVAGVDVTISYDSEKVSLLPSSLYPGLYFTTTGSIIDSERGTFSFSALSKDTEIPVGAVATFEVVPTGNWQNTEVDLLFETQDGKTAVIDSQTGENILGKANGIRLILSGQTISVSSP